MLKVGEMGVSKMGVDETGPTLVDKPFFYSLDVQNNYGTIYKMVPAQCARAHCAGTIEKYTNKHKVTSLGWQSFSTAAYLLRTTVMALD